MSSTDELQPQGTDRAISPVKLPEAHVAPCPQGPGSHSDTGKEVQPKSFLIQSGNFLLAIFKPFIFFCVFHMVEF